MAKIFQVPAILTRAASLKDGGMSLGFSTNELPPKDKVTAMEFHGKFGWLLFKESEFTDEDIPDGDPTDESKTPSQRLRAALFVLWKARGEKGDFNNFYQVEMEKAINKVKAALD